MVTTPCNHVTITVLLRRTQPPAQTHPPPQSEGSWHTQSPTMITTNNMAAFGGRCLITCSDLNLYQRCYPIHFWLKNKARLTLEESQPALILLLLMIADSQIKWAWNQPGLLSGLQLDSVSQSYVDSPAVSDSGETRPGTVHTTTSYQGGLSPGPYLQIISC